MKPSRRFSSAILVLSLPALWLGSFTVSVQGDQTPLSDEFTFIPVSIHASRSADYRVDPAADKFAPVDEDIMADMQEDASATESSSPTYVPPATEESESGEGESDSNQGGSGGQDSGDETPNRGNGNGKGNAGGNGKGKGPKK